MKHYTDNENKVSWGPFLEQIHLKQIRWQLCLVSITSVSPEVYSLAFESVLFLHDRTFMNRSTTILRLRQKHLDQFSPVLSLCTRVQLFFCLNYFSAASTSETELNSLTQTCTCVHTHPTQRYTVIKNKKQKQLWTPFFQN